MLYINTFFKSYDSLVETVEFAFFPNKKPKLGDLPESNDYLFTEWWSWHF